MIGKWSSVKSLFANADFTQWVVLFAIFISGVVAGCIAASQWVG